jgi:hypothetical protein
MNRLARVAADSVGASRCISIKKYPDGLFNKAFLMSMDDGREVIAKVLNLMLASHTLLQPVKSPLWTSYVYIDLHPHRVLLTRLIWEARKVLETPAPRVYSWNS